jgi:hypothetical protein
MSYKRTGGPILKNFTAQLTKLVRNERKCFVEFTPDDNAINAYGCNLYSGLFVHVGLQATSCNLYSATAVNCS